MSYILHLGHQPTDIPGPPISTSSAGFESNLDTNCIILDTFRGTTSLTFSWQEGTSDTTWISFRGYHNSNGDPFNDNFLKFNNTIDGTIVNINVRSGNFNIIVNGDTTESFLTSYSLSRTFTAWFDIAITVTTSIITCEFYIDGVSQGSVTAANTVGLKNKPETLVLDVAGWAGGSLANEFFLAAHFAVLDGVSTVGRRFVRQTPDVAATHTDFSGSIDALADSNSATSMSSNTSGDRQSFTLTGPTVPSTAISSVIIKHSATAPANGSEPTSSTGFLKIGGINYDSTPVAFSDQIQQSYTVFTENPSNSSPWDNASLPDEFGIVTSA